MTHPNTPTIDTITSLITENTTPIKYAEYISTLTNTLGIIGITRYGTNNKDPWHPSNLPAPRPLQKKQTAHQWHQEALERGYYTNTTRPHQKSLLEHLEAKYKKFTDHETFGQGGGKDYENIHDLIVNNPIHTVFMGAPITYNTTATALYQLLRTIGCVTLPLKSTDSDAAHILLPALMFTSTQHHTWFRASVVERYTKFGVETLLPDTTGLNTLEETAIGLPDFTVEDVEELDPTRIMESPVGVAYRDGFRNLVTIIRQNREDAKRLETIIPLFTTTAEKE